MSNPYNPNQPPPGTFQPAHQHLGQQPAAPNVPAPTIAELEAANIDPKRWPETVVRPMTVPDFRAAMERHSQRNGGPNPLRHLRRR